MNMSLDAQSSTKPRIRMAEEGVINRNFKVMNSSDSDQDEVKYINQFIKLQLMLYKDAPLNYINIAKEQSIKDVKKYYIILSQIYLETCTQMVTKDTHQQE